MSIKVPCCCLRGVLQPAGQPRYTYMSYVTVQVANWINGTGEDYMVDAWEELKYLRQVLVVQAEVHCMLLGASPW